MELQTAHAARRLRGRPLALFAAAVLLAGLSALQMAPCLSSSAVSEIEKVTLVTTETITNQSLKKSITQNEERHHCQDTKEAESMLDGRAEEGADQLLRKSSQPGLLAQWLSARQRLGRQVSQVDQQRYQLGTKDEENGDEKQLKADSEKLMGADQAVSTSSSLLIKTDNKEPNVQQSILLVLDPVYGQSKGNEPFVTCAPDYDDSIETRDEGLSTEEQEQLLNRADSSGLLISNGSEIPLNQINSTDGMPHNNRVQVQCIPSGSKMIEMITKVITPILFTIIIIVGLVGNVVVMLVILEDRKTERVLTPTGLLILDLSLADLSFIIFCIPFTGWDYSVGHWVFGLYWCKFNQYLIVVCALSSIYTLVLMSIDRFMAIVYPIECISYRTSKNTLYAIYIKWFLILLMASPTIQMHGLIELPGIGRPTTAQIQQQATQFDPTTTTSSSSPSTTQHILEQLPPSQFSCRFLSDQYNPLHFQIVFFVTSYLFPLILIFCLYLSLLKKLWFGSKPHGHKESIRTTESKKKVTWLVAGIVVVFALCWCPIQVMLILMRLKSHKITATYVAIQVFSHTLGYMNSCINPIVYAFASESFNNSFKRSSLGRFCYMCLCLNCRDHDRSSRRPTATNFRTIHNTTTMLSQYTTATTTTTKAYHLTSPISSNMTRSQTHNETELAEIGEGKNNNARRSNDSNVSTLSSLLRPNNKGNGRIAKGKIIALPLEPRDRDNKSPVLLVGMGSDNPTDKQTACQAYKLIQHQPLSTRAEQGGFEANPSSKESLRSPPKQQLVAHVVQSSGNQVSHRCESSYQEQDLAP